MVKKDNRNLYIGIIILLFIGLFVIFFADLIVPTLSSTPIRFDVSEGINIKVDPSSSSSTGTSGRSCVIYPNDQGC